MKKFLNFESFIIRPIIRILWVIGSGVCIIWGVKTILGPESNIGSFGFGIIEVFAGLCAIVLGPLVLRILCEFLIVPFYIVELLEEIKVKITGGTQ